MIESDIIGGDGVDAWVLVGGRCWCRRAVCIGGLIGRPFPMPVLPDIDGLILNSVVTVTFAVAQARSWIAAQSVRPKIVILSFTNHLI